MDLDRAPEPIFGDGCEEYAALPCTREAIDDYFNRRADALGQARPPAVPRYPDEWYADKDNRLRRKPKGSIRFENVGRGIRVVWVPWSNEPHSPP